MPFCTDNRRQFIMSKTQIISVSNWEEFEGQLEKLIYEWGCQEKQLPDGLRPPRRVLVEAASPLFRYSRKFRRFKNRPCNTVTEFGN